MARSRTWHEKRTKSGRCWKTGPPDDDPATERSRKAERLDVRRVNRMIKIVFFDAGETLLRAYPSFVELFASTCREAGHPVSVEEVVQVQKELGAHMLEVAYELG